MRHRTIIGLVLTAVFVMAPVPAYAVTIFGRVHVTLDGFKGYKADLKEGLKPILEGVPAETLGDGFFRLGTESIMLMGDGPIRWPESERNIINFTVGRYKIGIPTDWIGWKTGNMIFLQGVNCSVDREGGAYCTQDREKKDDLFSRYALRFGISGMRRRIATPVKPEKAKPAEPDVIRPSDGVISPSAPIRPSAPARDPEMEIIGPSD